jgi:hypothetical protein
MDKDLYNEEYFDFKKLAIPERFVKTKTKNCEYVFNTCIEIATKNSCVGLITEPGYSARSGIEDFQKNTRKYKDYFGPCSKSNNLKAILTDFLLRMLPPFVKINETNENYLMSSIGHHFKKIDSRRERIMIFYNIENLTGRKPFGVLYTLTHQIRNQAGVLVTINAARFQQLQNLAVKHSDISNFLSVFKWRELPAPSRPELGQHCFNRGALGKRVVDRLLNKAGDFRILNMEINKIRDLLVKKGYLKCTNL